MNECAMLENFLCLAVLRGLIVLVYKIKRAFCSLSLFDVDFTFLFLFSILASLRANAGFSTYHVRNNSLDS